MFSLEVLVWWAGTCRKQEGQGSGAHHQLIAAVDFDLSFTVSEYKAWCAEAAKPEKSHMELPGMFNYMAAPEPKGHTLLPCVAGARLVLKI